MKVREERVLADRKLAKNGGQLDELLTSCWEETTDTGPYPFDDKPIDWGAVLQGDRFFALLMIRATLVHALRRSLAGSAADRFGDAAALLDCARLSREAVEMAARGEPR